MKTHQQQQGSPGFESSGKRVGLTNALVCGNLRRDARAQGWLTKGGGARGSRGVSADGRAGAGVAREREGGGGIQGAANPAIKVRELMQEGLQEGLQQRLEPVKVPIQGRFPATK